MKTAAIALALAGAVAAQQPAYAQCGGIGWSGGTTCVSGYVCKANGQYYSQCVPGSAGGGASTTLKTTTTAAGGSTPTGGSSSGKVRYAGVNIAGFDFGCTIDGTCDLKSTYDVSSIGTTQMNHFVRDDGLNVFRLPVAWQYLVNNNLGGSLNANNWATYQKLVSGCLNSGAAACIIDVHNYARWNGQIIGQGGPTNAHFTSLWAQIAKAYAGNSKVWFGLMNEPHDVNINTWAQTVQAAVTAIRGAGATSNNILLPGNQFTSGAAFVQNGSGAALLAVKNPDGSTTGLQFDVHQYLDSDNSGTHTNCVTNNNANWASLVSFLRTNKRQAILSETGGGANDSSCLKYVCEELDFMNKNSDVFLGWVGWSAGGFASTYELTLTPNGNRDVPLMTQCFAGKFK
ncbi:hypothetical protein KVT40_001173 [Elsinoe batatas]|uniref:Endoglucanase EG-II n=1 Tax=Elsinoe batatas TaxID=2601811 RepID=A0A8K0LH40_9PEZI|nr:hypothetical protein KVT40_001173 [Elsinoe batatas]